MTLARAPAGLRAAVRRTLGLPAVPASSAFQQAKLTAADAAASDKFGLSVAISGSTAVVGADGKNSGTGAAYVFMRSGTAWSQQAKLTAAGAAATVRHLGGDLRVHRRGGRALATKPGPGRRMCSSGRGRPGPSRPKLTASDAAAGDAFGCSVAISGSTAVVGAPGKNSKRGAAYVFMRSGTAWSQQAELTASDGAAGDAFGSSVAISGSTAVVGAHGTQLEHRGGVCVHAVGDGLVPAG